MNEIFKGTKVSRNGLHEIITVAWKCLKTQLSDHLHPCHSLSSTASVRFPGLD